LDYFGQVFNIEAQNSLMEGSGYHEQQAATSDCLVMKTELWETNVYC
jgi:hypothetical protein